MYFPLCAAFMLTLEISIDVKRNCIDETLLIVEINHVVILRCVLMGVAAKFRWLWCNDFIEKQLTFR